MTALGPASLGSAAMDLAGVTARTLGGNPTLSQVQRKSMTPTQQRLMGAAQDFEGLLLQQLLTAMRSAHLAEDPLDSGNASDIMHSMLDAQMGKDIAHGRSFGLAEAIYREFVAAAGTKSPHGASSPAKAIPAAKTVE